MDNKGQHLTTNLGAAELLSLVYEELRKLAAHRLAHESPGHTLQPTALVHEAYLRLVGDGEVSWEGRGHFFAAAAESMRRILVEHARKRGRVKRGGGRHRVPIDVVDVAAEPESLDLVALDEALRRMEEQDPRMHQIVMLRFFAGLSVEDAGQALGISARTVKREWSCARAWLFKTLHGPR
jgi:RNA polymerase sigma factor (TIGR02999 family)